MVQLFAFFSIFSALCLFSTISAQQYGGLDIPNSLPQSTGAEIVFFNILDANGANTTLINYFSKPTTTQQRQDTSKVQRVVIVLHGSLRNADAYFKSAYDGLLEATKRDPDVNEETVAILTPYWANGEDKNKGYPFTEGQPPGLGSTSSALVWAGAGWSHGERNMYPHAQQSLSSYDVVDQLLDYFNRTDIYPNVHQIVIAGHSLGAQMAQRYASVAKDKVLHVPLRFWFGNPSSFVWYNKQRPVDPGQCATFDDWKSGLTNYTNQYEREFVQKGQRTGAVLGRYQARHVTLAHGLDDFGDDSNDCSPFSQGNNRAERTFNFVKAFPPDAADNIDYEPGIGHNHPKMMKSRSAQFRLFLDNFNGNFSRKADFGPRQVEGDNPRPFDT